MLERDFQSKLIKKLNFLFPGCFILKNDPSYLQGVPDLIILYKDRWACLEVKASDTAAIQPNQAYYVFQLNQLSFAAIISPETEEDILNDLQLAFVAVGTTRLSKRKQIPLV
jgi:hypothetical protein